MSGSGSGSDDAQMEEGQDLGEDAWMNDTEEAEQEILGPLARRQSSLDLGPFPDTAAGRKLAIRVAMWTQRKDSSVAYDRHGPLPDFMELAKAEYDLHCNPMHLAVPADNCSSTRFAKALKIQIDRIIPRAQAWLGDFASGARIEPARLRCPFSPKALLVRHARRLQRFLDTEIRMGYDRPGTPSIVDPSRAEDLDWLKLELANMSCITRVPSVGSLQEWQRTVAKIVALAVYGPNPLLADATSEETDGLMTRGCTYGLPGARAALLARVDAVDPSELRGWQQHHPDVGQPLEDWLSFPPRSTIPLAQLPHRLGKGREGYSDHDGRVTSALLYSLKAELTDAALINPFATDKGVGARLFTAKEVDAIISAVYDNLPWLSSREPNGDGGWWDDYLRWIEGFWDGSSQHMHPGALRCAIAHANGQEGPRRGEKMHAAFGLPTVLQTAVVISELASAAERTAAAENDEAAAERAVRGPYADLTDVLSSQRERTQDLVESAVDFSDDLTTAGYCNALHVQHAGDKEGLPRNASLNGKTVLREVNTDSPFFEHVQRLFAQSDPRMLGQGNDTRQYASTVMYMRTGSSPPTEPTVPGNGVADIEFRNTPYGQIVPIKVFEIDMEHRTWQSNPGLDASDFYMPDPNPEPQTTDLKAGYEAARAIVEEDLTSRMSMWYRKRKFPLAPRSELNPRGVGPVDPEEREGDPKQWPDPYFVDVEKLEPGTADTPGAVDRVNAAARDGVDASWCSPRRLRVLPKAERPYYFVNREGKFDDPKYLLEYDAMRATVALRSKAERKAKSEWPDNGALPELSLDRDGVGVHSAVHHTRLGRWWKQGLGDGKLTWTHKAITAGEPDNVSVDYAQARETGGLMHGGPMRYDQPDERATPQLNETMFLHGTASRFVPHLLAGGFDSFHTGTEGYFGAGTYFAEDPAKADQYARLAGHFSTSKMAFDSALQHFLGIEQSELSDAVVANGSNEQHVFYMVMARATTGLTAMTSRYNFTSLNRLGTFMAPEHAYREFVAAEFTDGERDKLVGRPTMGPDGSTVVTTEPVDEDGWGMLDEVFRRYWHDNCQGGAANHRNQKVHGEKRNFVERNELLFEEVWQYVEFFRSAEVYGNYGFRPPSRLFRSARWDDEPNVARRYHYTEEGVPRVAVGIFDKKENRQELGNQELAIRSFHSHRNLPYLAVSTSAAHQTSGSNMNRQEQLHRQYHCLQCNGFGGRTMRGTGQRWEHKVRFEGQGDEDADSYFGGQLRYREFVMFQNRRNTPAAVLPQFLVAYKRLPSPVTDVTAEGPRALVEYDGVEEKNDDYTRDSGETTRVLIDWETPTVYSLEDPYCPCETWDPSRWRHSLHDYPTIYQQMPYVMGRRTRTDAYTPPLIFDYYGDWLSVLNSVPESDYPRTDANVNKEGVMDQLQVSDRVYNPDERGPYHPSGALKREDDEDAVMSEPQFVDWAI